MNNEAIVLGLVNRDKVAIGSFWQNYYDKIYPICAQIIGRSPDAHDITVDILIDFIDYHAERLVSPRALYAFLRQAAVRRSIRYMERQNRNTEFDSDNHVSEHDPSEESTDLHILKSLLQQCLDKLTPRSQAILRMKYNKKISNERIGQIVGGSKSYIGRLIKQGQELLRRCIENKLRQASTGRRTGMNIETANSAIVDETMLIKLFEMRIYESDRDCSVYYNTLNSHSLKRTDRHLESCSLCRRTLAYLQELDAQDVQSSDNLPRRLIRKIDFENKWKMLSIAAVVLVAVAVSYFVSGIQTAIPESGQTLYPKGQHDRFFVAVERGASQFTAKPLDELLVNDRLGLFYSADESGYLAVFSMDNNQEISLLYPAGGNFSAPIVSGERVSLRDGAVVDTGTGCEWVLAVFSATPLHIPDIEKSISGSVRDGNSAFCNLEVRIPGARSVVKLPFRRQDGE